MNYCFSLLDVLYSPIVLSNSIRDGDWKLVFEKFIKTLNYSCYYNLYTI